MTTYVVWQSYVLSEIGRPVPYASVEVRLESDNSLATIYANVDGSTPLSNPFTADADGFARFYAASDSYSITVRRGSSSKAYRDVVLAAAATALGDVTGPTSSADGAWAVYNGLTGKIVKQNTLTAAVVKATAGVPSAAVAGTDYAAPTSGSAILKGNGAGGFSSAVAGTDYAAPTSGSAVLKGNGAGGFSSAVAGTDYAAPTSGSAILKGNGAGGFSSAVSGTDYAPATSGTAILKGNGSGGFSSATANTDYLTPPSGTSILKAGSGGALANATAGTDYLDKGTTSLLTKGFTVTPYNGGTVSSGTYTPAASDGNLQYYTNNGAHTLAAPSADSAIDILITNGASAGSITFSGFTVSVNVGDTLTTTNTSKFVISIRRINSVSTYVIKALQ